MEMCIAIKRYFFLTLHFSFKVLIGLNTCYCQMDQSLVVAFDVLLYI